jgi:uncharacterized SAM-binding protein YcdF (DUF218 family)
LLTLLAILLGLSYIPTRIAIARKQAPEPQLIFVLGGGNGRERLATQLAQQNPELKVWVSSGAAEGILEFASANIPRSRLYFDHRASDTVTNFTTVVQDLKYRNIQHVYVVTSDFHLARAKTIATIVFGTHGIAVTPVTVESQEPRESPIRIARDFGRSLLWLSTGRTGASLGQRLK